MINRVDVPKQFGICVKRLGGVLLDDDHGPNDRSKADYWFSTDAVIGELKVLSRDYLDNPAFKAWLRDRHARWVRRGLAPFVVGKDVVNLATLPKICTYEVTSFLKKRLEGTLKQANSQIKASRETLNAPSALGLLILANDGNSALPPGMVEIILSRSMRLQFSAINSVIYFTANMPSELPGTDKDVLFWVDWNVKSVRPVVPQTLIERLRDAWISRHSEVVGEPIHMMPGSDDDLYNLKFLGPTKLI